MHKQNTLFQYFSDTFDRLIAADKKEGKYDMGILGEPRWGCPSPGPGPPDQPLTPLALPRPGPWH